MSYLCELSVAAAPRYLNDSIKITHSLAVSGKRFDEVLDELTVKKFSKSQEIIRHHQPASS